MFNLKKPCITCPFRKGQGELFQLPEKRLEEIFYGPAFQCHKTVDYSEESPTSGEKPQQCAGLMAVLHREHEYNAIMKAGIYYTQLDVNELDPDQEAYASFDEVRKAHNV